ncbi:hypothetical protein GQ44DRAFT_734452 [Phaeosphaeriaceae sp. PMI808]|nr:hypothetical protein GQ44DRAFT_734452 [Phaeosphaeriaceae sp. PMI808]
MSDISIPALGFAMGFLCFYALALVLILTNILYNVYLHPLQHVPGPFWARANAIPSWYYAYGVILDLWQEDPRRTQFGPILRPKGPKAIYSMKSNVRRSAFYVGLTTKIREKNTLNTIDPTEHTHRHKVLNTCFTDQSVTAVSAFIGRHIDHWHQILLDEHDGKTEWSAYLNLSQKMDHLVFDIMGDLCFGRSFYIKEPGDNPLREVPHNIAQYLKFYYPGLCYLCCISRLQLITPDGL